VAVLDKNLEKAVNNASHRVKLRGNQVIVPLTYDEDGEVATLDKTIFKRLNRNDLRFLLEWQKTDYTKDVDELCKKTGLERSRVDWYVKKLTCFKNEDARTQAFCTIPSVEHIKARHQVNSYTDELTDGQRDSLKELAKIVGAYKNTAQVSITQNVFNLPKLTPEVEQKFKQLAEEALDAEQVA
jgi:hypothetical protein